MEKEYGLKEALINLRFDETIIIFGFQQGEYIKELEQIICSKNKIYIFEPDEIEYIKYKDTIKNDLIKLIYSQDDNIEDILSNILTKKNFLNANIQIYGNYDVMYENEYSKFESLINQIYYNCTVAAVSIDTFKSITLKNLILNIKALNNSYNFNSYLNINKNIPAMIVSAGPSLDRNIQTMIKNKEKLEKFIVIAGNRTIQPLLEAGIIPDLVTSVDPQNVTYNMMKNSIDKEIPLVFFEKSNYKLVDKYKGIKIAISQGVFNNIKGLEQVPICIGGGSVVHVATDIAYLLGCNPIIFVGQDFGYVDNKSHAEIATNEIDKTIIEEDCIVINDVYGKELNTSELLNFYKLNLERFIQMYRDIDGDLNFYNVSYGADIKGATHKNLDDILKIKFESEKKNIVGKGEKLNVDYISIINNIDEYMEYTLKNIKESKEICDRILENPTNKNVVKFEKVINTIDEFIKDKRSIYVENYIETFLIYIKEKLFKMKAKDYESLSNNIIYQSKVFREYMNDLEMFVYEIRDIIKNC